jgi:hypothetical protein
LETLHGRGQAAAVSRGFSRCWASLLEKLLKIFPARFRKSDENLSGSF